MNPYKIILPLLLVLIIGCGSASAPPISLPAPLTGKVTISSPDDDGFIHVDGAEGAVDGGMLVMAINENTAVTSRLEKALEGLVPSAYAEDALPDICSETGHACDEADTVGAFSILIPGQIGHYIVVVVIDSLTGEEISDRTTFSVPQGVTPVTNAPVGIFYDSINDLMYVVMQGDAATSLHNKMLVMNLGAGTKEIFDAEGYSAVGLGYDPDAKLLTLVDSDGIYFYNTPLTSQSVATMVPIAGATGLATLEYAHDQGVTNRLMWVSVSTGEFVYAIDLENNFKVTPVKPGFDNATLLGCRDMSTGSVEIQNFFVKRVALLCDVDENGSVSTGIRLYEFSDGGLAAPVPVIVPKSLFYKFSSDQDPKSMFFYTDTAAHTSSIALVSDGDLAGVQSVIEEYPIAIGGPNALYELDLTEPFAVLDPLKHIASPVMMFMSYSLGYGGVLMHDHNDDRTDGVAIFDLATNTVISRYSVGLYPTFMTVDTKRNDLYVTNKTSKTIFKAAVSDLIQPN